MQIYSYNGSLEVSPNPTQMPKQISTYHVFCGLVCLIVVFCWRKWRSFNSYVTSVVTDRSQSTARDTTVSQSMHHTWACIPMTLCLVPKQAPLPCHYSMTFANNMLVQSNYESLVHQPIDSITQAS